MKNLELLEIDLDYGSKDLLTKKYQRGFSIKNSEF